MGLNYYANFVNTSVPFFARGGRADNTTNAGMFAFNNTNGNTNTTNGFRVAVPVL